MVVACALRMTLPRTKRQAVISEFILTHITLSTKKNNPFDFPILLVFRIKIRVIGCLTRSLKDLISRVCLVLHYSTGYSLDCGLLLKQLTKGYVYMNCLITGNRTGQSVRQGQK